MFNQQDYYSDEEQNIINTGKHTPAHKVLLPNSGSDFNHLTGEGESLLKMMKERGLDMNQNEIRKLKVHNSSKDKEASKSKQKGGFFDGGPSASFQQLLKALNRSLSLADPQQASAILTHILQKKTLTQQDFNKFGIMKCKILFGLGAYQDCQIKAQSFLQRAGSDYLAAAIFSNYLAKAKGESGLFLEGYMDFLRSKAYAQGEKGKIEQNVKDIQQNDEFKDSEIDTLIREIDHTQMEYNIKMSKFKNSTNLIHPYYQQLRHRNVIQIACGDYHTLFLVSGAVNSFSSSNIEVLGLGQNTVGQILGRPSKDILKQPIVIVDLSGKGITGITATRESSLAWDQKGQIYEWGIKQKRDQKISISYSINQKINQLQKGYQHYGCLTTSGKFYTWGNIFYKGAVIIKQQQPYLQPAQGIVSISCGLNHLVSIDRYGDSFVFGSNEYGQLGLEGQMHCKVFKKFNNNLIGPLRKAYCIFDATFFVTNDEQLYIAGKISHNKQPIEKLRQGQFSNDVRRIISLVGNVGNYYITDEKGTLYHWEVDSSVKFKIEKENQKIAQRYVETSRGNLFKVRSLIAPELSNVKLLSDDLRSYDNIDFQIRLFDKFGPYGNPNFVTAPRCQIFFSTYAIKAADLQRQNKQFLQSYQFSNDDSTILLNEIIQSRLSSFKLSRDLEAPQIFRLTIITEQSGKFYFYIMLQDKIIFSQELSISVSQRQKQLSQKNKKQKQIKQQERRKKAELQKQKMHDQKIKRQMEQEEKRRETQKRAQEAFKKHMREQQELKTKAQEERKARKQLMTGGGFDLSKIKPKNQKIQQPIDPMIKTNESFLPSINVRPSSKRKLNLPAKNSAILSSFESVKPYEKSTKIQETGNPGVNLFKSQSGRQKQIQKVISTKGADSLSKTGGIGGGKQLMKRGLSKGKK